VEYVAASDVRGDPLGDRLAGAHALRDFKRHRLHARAAPATVNLELAAIDTLYRSRGIEPPVIERLELPTLAPRALQRREQIELLRARVWGRTEQELALRPVSCGRCSSVRRADGCPRGRSIWSCPASRLERDRSCRRTTPDTRA